MRRGRLRASRSSWKSGDIGRLLGVVLATLVLAPGCYYTQLAAGQLRLMMARSSIAELESDPATSPRLRAQLALVERVRAFASRLGLEVGGRYTSYVDWPGDRVVTTVVATRPGEVKAAGFTFPIVGTVPYKGYFDEAAAQSEAASLRARGLDVCVVPVAAYSTLGWMNDPVTAPMLQDGDVRLVETVLHELVHATVFVESQPAFNEGVARFIGQEGTIRFFAGDPDAERRAVAQVADDRAIAAALLEFRQQVAALYSKDPYAKDTYAKDTAANNTATKDTAAPGEAKTQDADAERRERAALERAFRAQLAAMPLATVDAATLARRVRLNDACLAIGDTYAADTTRLEQLLARLHGDLPRFIARLRRAARTDDPRATFFAEPPAPKAATARREPADAAPAAEPGA